VRLLLAVVVLGGIGFLFVLPGRTWLQQGRAMSIAQHRVSVLAQEDKDLSIRASQLQSPAYVEQLARQEYGLVMPGEKAYAIIPPLATTTTTAPPPSSK
jgi:cell division protein FtsB